MYATLPKHNTPTRVAAERKLVHVGSFTSTVLFSDQVHLGVMEILFDMMGANFML